MRRETKRDTSLSMRSRVSSEGVQRVNGADMCCEEMIEWTSLIPFVPQHQQQQQNPHRTNKQNKIEQTKEKNKTRKEHAHERSSCVCWL